MALKLLKLDLQFSAEKLGEEWVWYYGCPLVIYQKSATAQLLSTQVGPSLDSVFPVVERSKLFAELEQSLTIKYKIPKSCSSCTGPECGRCLCVCFTIPIIGCFWHCWAESSYLKSVNQPHHHPFVNGRELANLLWSKLDTWNREQGRDRGLEWRRQGSFILFNKKYLLNPWSGSILGA